MLEITQKVEPSFCVTVFVAGDLDAARQSLRRQCFEEGLCVTLTPTTFIYTGGAEEGVAVGHINYPRFPRSPEEVTERAVRTAKQLMEDLCQGSCSVVTPIETIWLTRRPGDKA